MKKQMKPKDPQFPFDEPSEKAADMFHDGYTLKEVLFYVGRAWNHHFDRELTEAEVHEIKEMSHEYN